MLAAGDTEDEWEPLPEPTNNITVIIRAADGRRAEASCLIKFRTKAGYDKVMGIEGEN
jgi:hypothetical protein